MPDKNFEVCEVFLSLTDVERCFDLMGNNNLTDLDRRFDLLGKSGPLLEVGGQQVIKAGRDPTRIAVRRHCGAFKWARLLILQRKRTRSALLDRKKTSRKKQNSSWGAK
jgi:hypothetical protein